MIFFQRVSMVHGFLNEMQGQGIEVTVRIDDKLSEIRPGALSEELGCLLTSVLKKHYGLPNQNSYGVNTQIDPWPYL